MPACAHAYRYNHMYNLEKMSFSKNVSKPDMKKQERDFCSFLSVKVGKRCWGSGNSWFGAVLMKKNHI